MRGISWLVASQSAAQEGPCTMEWVSKCGTCRLSCFWRLEFCGGSHIFWQIYVFLAYIANCAKSVWVSVWASGLYTEGEWFETHQSNGSPEIFLCFSSVSPYKSQNHIQNQTTTISIHIISNLLITTCIWLTLQTVLNQYESAFGPLACIQKVSGSKLIRAPVVPRFFYAFPQCVRTKVRIIYGIRQRLLLYFYITTCLIIRRHLVAATDSVIK